MREWEDSTSSSAHRARARLPPRHAAGLGRADPPRAPARRCSARSACGTRRAAQLPGRAPDPLHDPPVVGPGQEAAAVGDGRRAGRDLAAVRAHRGQDRSDLARAGRRAAVPRSYGHPHWELSARPRSWRASTSRCTACRSSRIAGSPTGRSIRRGRELFILHALVRHEYTTKGAFMEHNRAVLDEVQRSATRPGAATCWPTSTRWEFFDRAAAARGVQRQDLRGLAQGPPRPPTPTVLHLDARRRAARRRRGAVAPALPRSR
jgi:hypothetical protein